MSPATIRFLGPVDPPSWGEKGIAARASEEKCHGKEDKDGNAHLKRKEGVTSVLLCP